jgi:hypothetical protein
MEKPIVVHASSDQLGGCADRTSTGQGRMSDRKLLEKIADGLAHGEYSLLAGAGASLGAIGGDGRALPSGPELRDALIKDFDIDTGGESISLARAYDHLSRRDRTGVSKYLKSWFTGCRPSWQGLLAEFNWHRIWTLNIDDVLEIAFQAQGRPLQTFGWRQRFVDRNWSRSSQIIHLHGSAAQLLDPERADEPLVFSIQEYARALADARSWHGVFR